MIAILKRIHIGVIVISSLLLLAAIGWGIVWNYALQKTVPAEVTAGGLPIGGMPVNDALAMLEQIENTLQERTVTVHASAAAGDSKQWKVPEFGYKADFSGARTAILKLKEGSTWDRAVYRYNFAKNYPLLQSWNRDSFDAAIRKQWSWLEKSETKNAERIITEQDEVRYEPHVDAYRLEPGKLIEDVEKWIIVKEEQLRTSVERHFEGELTVAVIHPDVTLEKLKAEGVERKIIEFSTDFSTNAEGRAYNVTVTADALNDWHLAPDETFDYGKLIARAEELYEYREAPVILNGKLVPGIGGGICQVSSTLYNAAVRAGLEIVERRNHSLPVAYLPLGQDATYAGGAINFRFKNTTGKHLLIRTEVKDRKLTVKLFGTMDENVQYGMESVTLKTVQPVVQEKVNSELSPGQKVTVDKGKPGYLVDTYRTTIKDGKVIARDKISHDTYRAQPTIVEVGPMTGGPAPTPVPEPIDPILEDGI
ncbi:VanW family protein [Paenibacillus sp. N4]|uniref:VanW family protein n=1 Tax=Paenibacillus vietnamensis TaxID=2590547 RepID=UPI001CD05C69|nr:VanW family protein [Paenibacillus vietnamensis]MCA0757575.1 VanW family protein [Paenibacillus vietnamensis]